MAVNKWTEEAHVRRYLGHAGTLPHRAFGAVGVVVFRGKCLLTMSGTRWLAGPRIA